MSRSYKKNLITKSGRWLKKTWYRIYRKHIKAKLKRDLDDINIESPNSRINDYNITDQHTFCDGDYNNCWCRNQYSSCKIKRK